MKLEGTSFFQAVEDGDIDAVRRLLREEPALAHARSAEGWSALQLATRQGRVELVIALLEQGADVNVVSPTGETPLHLAVRANNSELVQLLLGRGAAVSRKAAFLANWTPLHFAAEHQDGLVGKLLIAAGADLEATDDSGDQPIHAASRHGNAQLIHALLDRGVNINSQGQDGWTPLHFASDAGHVGIVEILIARSAETNQKDAHGWTPLHRAIPMQPGVIGFLLTHGADLDLRAAVECGMTNIVHCLLRYESLMFREGEGDDLLSRAVRTGKLEIIDLLISHGADVNSSVEEPIPLFVALELDEDSRDTVVKLLLRHGADPEKKQPATGQSLIDWARDAHDEQLLAILEDAL